MKKGFTLVELLIVLAVIAALMAVATPMALNAVKQAKASQVAQNLSNIMTALQNYVNLEHDFTTDIDALVSKGYLSSKPDKYTIVATPTGSTWSSSGEKRVRVQYGGNDVDVEKGVRKQNPNVKNVGGVPTLEATFTKWW